MVNNRYLRCAALSATLAIAVCITGCRPGKKEDRQTPADTAKMESMSKEKSKPLVTDIFTADPSAHVFNDRIYVYPSHDIETGAPENDMGDHFNMRDYHVLS